MVYYDSIFICDSKNSYLCKLNQKQDNYIDYNIKKINIKGEISYVATCLMKNKEGKSENFALIAEKKNAILQERVCRVNAYLGEEKIDLVLYKALEKGESFDSLMFNEWLENGGK